MGTPTTLVESHLLRRLHLTNSRYRTVLWTVGTVVAGEWPWELQAQVVAEVYRYWSSLRAYGQIPSVDQICGIRAQAQKALLDWWMEDLGTAGDSAWLSNGEHHTSSPWSVGQKATRGSIL